MIPSVSGFLDQEFEVEEEPSKNYRMDIYGETFCGKIDGLEAMKQVIYKILNTERYQHILLAEDIDHLPLIRAIRFQQGISRHLRVRV